MLYRRMAPSHLLHPHFVEGCPGGRRQVSVGGAAVDDDTFAVVHSANVNAEPVSSGALRADDAIGAIGVVPVVPEVNSVDVDRVPASGLEVVHEEHRARVEPRVDASEDHGAASDALVLSSELGVRTSERGRAKRGLVSDPVSKYTELIWLAPSFSPSRSSRGAGST